MHLIYMYDDCPRPATIVKTPSAVVLGQAAFLDFTLIGWCHWPLLKGLIMLQHLGDTLDIGCTWLIV